MGREPADHYGIYIRTLGDAKWYLDLGMYTFNLACVVDATPYRKYNLSKSDTVPAYFVGKEWSKACGAHSLLFQPRRYMSVLRDPRVHRIAQSEDLDYCKSDPVPAIASIMEEIAGRECFQKETDYMMGLLGLAVKALRMNVSTRDWMNFPAKPKIDFDTDEDEGVMDATPEKEALVDFTNHWAKRVKKGNDTREHFNEEVQKLVNLPQEDRLKNLGVRNKVGF